MINLKAIAITSGASLLFGTFAGGYLVHKLWWGKVQADKAKATQTTLDMTQDALEKQKSLAEDETDRADKLNQDLQRTRQALNDAMQANAVLAASRASTTTRIIDNGEQLGKKLEGDYAWLRYAWPSELLDYANGSAGTVAMPEAEKSGYR